MSAFGNQFEDAVVGKKGFQTHEVESMKLMNQMHCEWPQDSIPFNEHLMAERICHTLPCIRNKFEFPGVHLRKDNHPSEWNMLNGVNDCNNEAVLRVCPECVAANKNSYSNGRRYVPVSILDVCYFLPSVYDGDEEKY